MVSGMVLFSPPAADRGNGRLGRRGRAGEARRASAAPGAAGSLQAARLNFSKVRRRCVAERGAKPTGVGNSSTKASHFVARLEARARHALDTRFPHRARHPPCCPPARRRFAAGPFRSAAAWPAMSEEAPQNVAGSGPSSLTGGQKGPDAPGRGRSCHSSHCQCPFGCRAGSDENGRGRIPLTTIRTHGVADGSPRSGIEIAAEHERNRSGDATQRPRAGVPVCLGTRPRPASRRSDRSRDPTADRARQQCRGRDSNPHGNAPGGF